ncbi:MAG: cation diffusion facilitator family transporter [Thermodesulfobacteriota bacterium]
MLGKHGGASKEAAARSGAIAGLIDTMVAGAALAVSDSSVVLADFFKTALEFVAVFLAWQALKRVAKGGHQFEYGLDKLENLSGLVVGLMMLACLVIISAGAVLDMLHPEPVQGPGIYISLAAQVFFGVINWRVYRQAEDQAKASPLARSQARLFLTRFIGNIFILLALTLSLSLHGQAWALYIDPVASLLIAASILLAALGVFRTSIFDLLDRSLEEEEQIRILRALVRHYDQYRHLHGIRTRRAGGRTFIEVFLEFDPERPVGDVQNAVEALQASLEEEVPGSRVTIGLATKKVA